jgi:hypothetical protein
MPDGGFPPDITADITVLHEQKIRTGNEITDLGEKHIRTVATKPVKASPDINDDPDIFEIEPEDNNFPPDGIKYFVRVIAPKSDQTLKEDLALRTQSAGRADYRYPYPLVIKNTRLHTTTIMTKGSGSERSVERTKSPFCHKLGGA